MGYPKEHFQVVFSGEKNLNAALHILLRCVYVCVYVRVQRLTISLISVWVERFVELKTALSLDACHTKLRRERGREIDMGDVKLHWIGWGIIRNC